MKTAKVISVDTAQSQEPRLSWEAEKEIFQGCRGVDLDGTKNKQSKFKKIYLIHAENTT